MESFTFAALAALGLMLAAPSVNVNTAQQSELQSTRGLDRAAAKRIIEYRNQHGPYSSLEDLEKVIGPEATGRISEHVRFEGDPYEGPPRPAKKRKRAPAADRQARNAD